MRNGGKVKKKWRSAMKDFSNYKFRASGIKNLMTRSRSKKDPLSETTKSYLQEVYIEAVYGRKKVVISPAMQKGTIVETNSIELMESVTGRTYFKNNKQLENDFISGTPDIIDKEEKTIRDIKSSWDLWTFAKVTEKSATRDYYYQIMSYLWLTGSKKGFLNYALVDTPEMIVNDEIYRLSFKMPEDEADAHRVNYEFGDIPGEKRLKEYEFDFDENEIDKIKEKILMCRNYLNNYSL